MPKSVTHKGNRHNKKNKGMKRRSMKRKSMKNVNKYQINALPTTLRIINEAKSEYEKMLISTDRPLLNRLFREKNIEKLRKLPKELTDIRTYTKVLNKEFAKFKKNKKIQPNQDYYDYVNENWINDQTAELKKNPQYYVEVDDFRIIQDKVYREVIEHTKTYIKSDPTSKKSKSINAVINCVQKASKRKDYIIVKKY